MIPSSYHIDGMDPADIESRVDRGELPSSVIGKLRTFNIKSLNTIQSFIVDKSMNVWHNKKRIGKYGDKRSTKSIRTLVMKRPDKTIDDLEDELSIELNKNSYPYFFFDKKGGEMFFKNDLGRVNITMVTQGILRISINIV